MGVLLIVLWTVLGFCVFMLFKNENTCKQQHKIINAIFDYQMSKLGNQQCRSDVDYTDMESYESTLLRLYDWGYENILPHNKFELVKPFIDSNKTEQ